MPRYIGASSRRRNRQAENVLLDRTGLKLLVHLGAGAGVLLFVGLGGVDLG